MILPDEPVVVDIWPRDPREARLLGTTPGQLLAGDVITIEPGIYRPGFGGRRLPALDH